MAQTIEIEKIEDTAAYLGPYIQSGSLNFLLGSGASFPAIKVAGEIETEINNHLREDSEDVANSKCLDFIETIGDVHAALSLHPQTEAINRVVGAYVRFVSLVDDILFSRKNLLLPRQATVFTTNYDMFVEHAASQLPNIILNDGFERSSGLNPVFTFAPERYFDRTYRSGPIYGHQTEIPTVNLVKLHGSLSWRRDSGDVVFDPTPVNRLTSEEKANRTKVKEYLERHFLILPNFRKFHATLIERVYYDLLRLFSKAMDQENAVLISFGFSFADEHILDITRRSLRNPTSQLIIFSYDQAAIQKYQAKFSEHRNVAVLSPKKATFTDFDAFNKILASVIPATSHDK